MRKKIILAWEKYCAQNNEGKGLYCYKFYY